MRRRSGVAVLLCVGLLLAALAVPAGARLPGAAGPGCSWPLTLRNINFAYPDTSADYWMTHFGAVPGSSLKITGEFPSSRYFSFHAYDEAQKPVASISDHEIVPDEGVNPFDKNIPGRGPQSGKYTVRVVFEPEPGHRFAFQQADEYVPPTWPTGERPQQTPEEQRWCPPTPAASSPYFSFTERAAPAPQQLRPPALRGRALQDKALEKACCPMQPSHRRAAR